MRQSTVLRKITSSNSVAVAAPTASAGAAPNASAPAGAAGAAPTPSKKATKQSKKLFKKPYC